MLTHDISSFIFVLSFLLLVYCKPLHNLISAANSWARNTLD